MRRILKSSLKKVAGNPHHVRRYARCIPRLSLSVVRSPQLAENPEVSRRLTNLSQRHAGQRPAWIDAEPLSLSSHVRQCRRMLWQILTDHRQSRKRIIALTADPGMGKTSFLAQLYTMLERAPDPVMTLAPIVVHHTPFEMMRILLEQRFYISGTATLESIGPYVESAVSSMLSGDQSKLVFDSVMGLWRRRAVVQKDARKSPPPLQTQVVRVPGMPVEEDAVQPALDKETADEIESLAKSLTALLEADLAHNSLVVMLDDVTRYDRASLHLLAMVYNRLPDLPLTVLMTMSAREMVPPMFRGAQVDYVALQCLSDDELVMLTQNVFRDLSKSREKVIVPDDICRMIAQRSLGSPHHAIQLALRHFDSLPRHSEVMARLRRTPVRKTINSHIVDRFRACLDRERQVLRFASLLNAPFTVSTIECIASSYHEPDAVQASECRALLRHLRDKGFICKAQEQYGANTVSYVFSLEVERQIIAESATDALRDHVCGVAAQWYALNNVNRRFDEVIGDLWSRAGAHVEACHYYVRAAYQAYRRSELPKARVLFRKLLANLPDDNLSRRIQYSLDDADIVFRLGCVDEAFLQCRRTSHYAMQLASYAQSARAYIQMASMLLEIGSMRHIRRYLSHAQELLNRESDPQTLCALHVAEARFAMINRDNCCAACHIAQARACMDKFVIPRHDRDMLEFCAAQLEARKDNPVHALEKLVQIADAAAAAGDIHVECRCLRAAGQIRLSLGNITDALEAWNRALGLAQEMNDVILHATLLADIADGAIALDAHRTARSASEQCMNLAQQTRQKALIARCLIHNARLNASAGMPDRALRCLYKAHKTARSLRNWTVAHHVLVQLAAFLGKDGGPSCAEKAGRIYKHLVKQNSASSLAMCEILPLYIAFLDAVQNTGAARHFQRNLQDILYGLGFEKACDKVQEQRGWLM